MELYDGLDTLVGSTASSVAVSRMLGTLRSDGFLSDPLAAYLVSETFFQRTVERMQLLATENSVQTMQLVRPKQDVLSTTNAATLKTNPNFPGSANATPVPNARPPCLNANPVASADVRDNLPKASTSNYPELHAEDCTCGTPPGPQTGARSAVDLICLRTKCIDDEIVDILTQMRDAFAHAQLQVVLLGAGMDSRPWRLQGLPQGVGWWEVDTRAVVEAKTERLRLAGAQVDGVRDSSQPSKSASSGAIQAPTDGHVDESTESLLCCTGLLNKPAYKFPLLVERWSTVAANLCAPSWTAALAAAGWLPDAPTLWVAEGLLYYLTQEDAQQVLRSAASRMTTGTAAVLIASHMNEGMLRNWAAMAREDEAYEVGAAFKCSAPDDNPASCLTGTGWTEEQVFTLADMAMQYEVDVVRSAADTKHSAKCGASDYFVIEAVLHST